MLESYLKEHSPIYFGIYEKIKAAMQEIWLKPRLDWYTDHGPEHSERIICHLNDLCSGLLKDPAKNGPEYGLCVAEVFLLLTAAWIHDVGMQDLSDINNLSVDKMDEVAWNAVRLRHPQRAFEIIMQHAAGSDEQNEFWLGLKREPQIHTPLALICKGHGSDHYNEVVKEFERSTFNLDGKHQEIRGALLTSLLLMADECDLHRSRSIFKENYPLSKISKLHNYRHHYIEDVKICSGIDGNPNTHKTICITFRFPELGDGERLWQNQIQQWIYQKLQKESHLVFSCLHKGFEGHFQWAEPLVKIETQNAVLYEKLIMEKEIQYSLTASLEKVIDWKDLTAQLTTRFKDKQGGIVSLLAEKSHGVERFIDFIKVIYLSSLEENEIITSTLAVLNFSFLLQYHSIIDVFDAISEQIGFCENDTENGLIEHLMEQDKFYFIILQDVHAIDKELLNQIDFELEKLSRKSASNLLFLLTTKTELQVKSTTELFSLPEAFEAKDIKNYFIASGDNEDDAVRKTDYLLDQMEKTGDNSAHNCMICIRNIDEFLGGLSTAKKICY